MANNAQTSTSLLLTRPQDSADRFLARLDPDVLGGVTVCISPLMKIVPTGLAPDLSGYAGAVLTSAQVVALAPESTGLPAYCVGAQTAERAAKAGWAVAVIAETADALVAALIARGPAGPLVHLAGAHRRGDIALRLGNRGIPVDELTLYDQHLLPLNATAQSLLKGPGPVIVPMFSPRTARQFVDQAQTTASAHVVAISPAVAAVLRAVDLNGLETAAAPTGEEMARSVEMLLRKTSLA